MGANCCVAAREKPLPSRVNHEVSTFSTYRNFRHSPPWSFRSDNRTHIEDIMENHAQFSNHNSGNAISEVKCPTDTETDEPSDGDSPSKTFQPSKWRFSSRSGVSENKCIAADQSTKRNSFPEVKGSLKLSVLPDTSGIKTSVSIPSFSPSTIKMADLSSSSSSIIPSNPTSKKICLSPGYQLCGQVYDSRIPYLKSLNEGNSPEVGRNSFVFSNELFTGGSHSGSSDGWSMMHTFSELVASSQRERWSFDKKNFGSFTNIFGSSMPLKTQHSPDPQTCGICSKLLKEKSPWSSNIVTTNDLSVVAVLVCGHVFHAECLESSTSEIERYDPPCPICENKGKWPTTLKQLGKYEVKGRNKISQIAVTYADVDEDPISDSRKRNGKGAIMGSSSSMKNSISSPLLKRHFSTGSRPVRSAVENETQKKGFWERYRRV